MGELLPSPINEHDKSKKSRGSKLAIGMLKGVAVVATLGIGGLYLGYQAAKRKQHREKLIAENPLESFTCDSCSTLQKYSDNELRYKCGSVFSE